MSDPIAVNERTAAALRQLIDQSQRMQDTLRTYVEAAGTALDVPQGWRFDTQTMAFVPPTTPAEAGQAQSAPPNE